jgi:hypothetical protein
LHVLVWNWVELLHCYLYHPCCCHGYDDPISMENRIWGDGNGTG